MTGDLIEGEIGETIDGDCGCVMFMSDGYRDKRRIDDMLPRKNRFLSR